MMKAMESSKTASAERQAPETLLDENALPFSIKCERHDKDRIEVKIDYDGIVRHQKGDFNFDIDFLLFCPRNLGLTELDSIDILKNEFQSYFRLHSFGGLAGRNISASYLLRKIGEFSAELRTDVLKSLAIELDSYLKFQRKVFKKIIKRFKKDNLHMEEVLAHLDQVESVIKALRSLLDTHEVYKFVLKSHAPRTNVHRELFLVNEYISHTYVQLLVLLHDSTSDLEDTHMLKIRIKSMIQAESKVREQYELFVIGLERNAPNVLKEDFYLRRMSLLKKYFHRPLQVQTSTRFLETRLLIPVYGMSAALAAAWAIMIQIYTVESTLERVSINTIAFISVGVLAYVAKDLMKDFFRKYLFKRSRQWFPDFEKKLFIKRGEAFDHFGVAKEFIRAFDSSTLPDNIQKQRYQGEVGAIENFLGEDVLHYRKKIKINLASFPKDEEQPWGFREIIRYRIDRLMVSMEDAYKKLPLLTSDGDIVLKEGRRIYQLHLVIQMRILDEELHNSTVITRAFRVSADKNGVISCYQFAWDSPIALRLTKIDS
jgi:hypothetical protein